jgi:hypothetical protein
MDANLNRLICEIAKLRNLVARNSTAFPDSTSGQFDLLQYSLRKLQSEPSNRMMIIIIIIIVVVVTINFNT